MIRTLWKNLVGLGTIAICATVVVAPNVARAEDSAYCRKVRARAAADAALLIAPTTRAEAIKLPTAIQRGGRIDPTAVGTSYQFRAGFSVSAVQIYKGLRLAALADSDCERQAVSVIAQELLLQAPDLGRLGALRSEVEYLDSRRSAWEAIFEKVSERFEAKTVTLLNMEDIRARVAVLARKREQAAGEIGRLEAVGIPPFRGTVPDLIRQNELRSMRFEEEGARIRSLDAWDLNVTGGYVPPILGSQTSDFFGLVQVSYNLGSAFHDAAEERYLAARDEELKTARYEVGRQLGVLQRHVTNAIEAAKQELAIVERRVAVLNADRAAIESSEAQSAFYALAMLELEIISVEADGVFLRGLVRELSQLEGN